MYNPPKPPQLNPYGGFGGEVGPTRGTLSPTPDAVINNLSAQLDRAIALHNKLVIMISNEIANAPDEALRKNIVEILNKH